MKATKENVVYIIYATPMNTSIQKVVQDILHQYQACKDEFEKKNTNMLLEH